MIQFFAPDIETSPVLPEQESRHCVRVLRTGIGDEVTVVDGRGFRYRCRMVDPHPDHALVQIEQRIAIPRPWPCNITLAIAPTKHNDRMEWLVEKIVEIGVDLIIPLKCRFSERKEIKTERLEKIAVSAMKQSLKATMPVVEDMITMKQFLSRPDLSPQKFVCYCDAETPRVMMSHACQPLTDTTILIGPEGDFSPEEISLARERGFIPVTLGDQRLRTETAALFAVSTIHIVNQIQPSCTVK